MIKLLDIINTTPGLDYHLNNSLPISENIYRYSSDSFIELFKEARTLWVNGKIQLPLPDVELLTTTDIGEYDIFEGKKIPLDLPMIDEGTFEDDEIAIYDGGEDGETSIYKRGTGYYGINNEFDFEAQDRAELEKKLQNWGYKLLAGSLDEAEYQGKQVNLGKPKRGGTKKFYVYVKDPKTKNVKKVSFGAKDGGGNLAVKLDDPKRRKAFADRHNCKDKKDKTKPGYWACRINRYWKSLGGAKNYPGYW